MSGLIAESWVKTQSVPQLKGVRTHAANFISRRDAPRHVHQEYAFGLITAGAMEIDCGHCGEKHILQPGDLLLTEADAVYSSRALGLPPWRFFSISVSKEKLNFLLDSAGGKGIAQPHFINGAVKHNELRRAFLKLHDALGEKRTLLEQESRLSEWIVSVYENYADDSGDSPRRRVCTESAAIRRAREFIRENFRENIKLQDLAEIAGLSAFHLNRAFSAQVGLPPHKFQNQLRIEKACNLIAHKKSFAEIAASTGFADQSHFNRFFKRYVGVTPKNFVAR